MYCDAEACTANRARVSVCTNMSDGDYEMVIVDDVGFNSVITDRISKVRG